MRNRGIDLLIRGIVLALIGVGLAQPGGAAPLTITTNGALGTNPIGQDQIPLNASGGTGNYTWSVAPGSTLPAGLNIAPIPGSTPVQIGIVGIATAPGSFAFSLTVNDGNTSVAQPFTLKISALTLKDPNIPDAFVNSAFSYTFTPLNNAGTVTFAVTTPALPSWLNLSPAGVLSGTPTAAGAYTVNFSIFDGVDTIYRGFQLVVYTVDLTTSGSLPNATLGSPYSASLTASGGVGGYQYTITGGGLPPNITMSGSGIFSGTPASGSGIYWFYVTATDAMSNSYQKTMSIDVVAPGAQNEISLGGTIDDAVVGLTYGWQIPICCGGTGPYRWTATGLPPGMSIRSGSGVTSDYIAPGYGEIWGLATTPGNYSVTVTVTDNLGATASIIIPFHVSVLSLAPFYNLPNGTINAPSSTTFQIIGGSGSYTSVVPINGQFPQGLALNTAALSSGHFTVSGTPTENGYFDPELKITDGSGNTLVRNNNFTINNTAGGITINNNGYLGSITAGANYSNQLSACCVANYIWSATPGSLPTGMNISSAGLLSGSVNNPGTYTFLIKAADAAGVAAAGYRLFTLNVTPISITTSSPLPYGNVGSVYGPVTLAATGGTGNLVWTVTAGNYLPTGFTLSSVGVLSSSGTVTSGGQYYFDITVTDSANPAHTADRGFSLNIYPAGQTPPLAISTGASLGTVSIGQDEFGLIATGGNGTYAWSVASGSTLPPGMALRTDKTDYESSAVQAVLVGVPTATVTSTYTFTLNVTSAGQTASRTFTLTVSPLTLIDVNVPDAFAGNAYSYQFTALDNHPGSTVTWSLQGASQELTTTSNGVTYLISGDCGNAI